MRIGVRWPLNGHSDWRSECSTVALTWLVLAVIVVMQALPFTYGYRRSADDLAFLAVLFGGRSLDEFAISAAVAQGRLGLLLTVPLNVLGTYLSGEYIARLSFVLMHFGVFALFAAYFSLISATNVTRALLIFLIALHPICRGTDHMPPTSYPLQNTLPFLALLIARCTIFIVQQRGRGGQYLLWPARVVFLAAMITTEFAFLLATALLAAEYAFALAQSRHRGESVAKSLLSVAEQRSFFYDVAIVAVALFAYLAFRWIYPSSYDGNVIDAWFEFRRVVETTVRHVLAGTVFSREIFEVASLPREALPMAALVGILTALCLFAVLDDVRALPLPLVVAFFSVLAIAYVTFPLAGNAKQQDWCVDRGACGYLDSRISYLGFAVIIICLVALVLRLIPTYRVATALVAVISLATGLVAATTYARNVGDGLLMLADARSWQRADLLACYPDIQPAADRQLLKMIDPESGIRFHPEVDKAKFWRDYMRFVRDGRRCPPNGANRQADLRSLSELGPGLLVGQTIYFNDGSAIRYLDTGWSQQETWGVWTDGDRAYLVILPRSAPGAKLWLLVVFTAYVPPSVGQQTIDVSVNGRIVDTWTISQQGDGKECCERSIALGSDLRPADEISIAFHISTPRNPDVDREIVDSRHLGLFLHSMTLTDSAGKGR
ncbi:MAG: hypothetical protein U1E21_23000 [Reyranellaceae bacterium]